MRMLKSPLSCGVHSTQALYCRTFFPKQCSPMFANAGSLVVLPFCGTNRRIGSDARTAHFRRFHVTAVSTTARQEDHAE